MYHRYLDGIITIKNAGVRSRLWQSVSVLTNQGLPVSLTYSSPFSQLSCIKLQYDTTKETKWNEFWKKTKEVAPLDFDPNQQANNNPSNPINGGFAGIFEYDPNSNANSWRLIFKELGIGYQTLPDRKLPFSKTERESVPRMYVVIPKIAMICDGMKDEEPHPQPQFRHLTFQKKSIQSYQFA